MKHIDEKTINEIHAEFDALRNIGAVVKSFAGVVPGNTVKDLLRSRRHEQIIVRSRDKKYSNDSIVEALLKADAEGCTTAVAYRAWREERLAQGEEQPSLALIIRRFGAWSTARQAACCGSIRKRVYSRELKTFLGSDIRSAFAQFVRECRQQGKRPTPAEYDSWSRTQGIPTPLLSTVRARMTTSNVAWSEYVRECERSSVFD